MKYFAGCTALITGASSGLGEEFARQLAPLAQTLIIAARRTERLEALKAELTRAHPQLKIYPYGLDLADSEAIDLFLKWLWAEGLRVDFLINNAGVGDHGEFARGDWDKVQQMLNVNIGALTKLTHRLLPMLRSFDRAAILNVSSVASFAPVPSMAIYAATKAYVTSFSEALRVELRGTGVSVTALCPGPVDTEFGQAARRDDAELSAPDFLKVSPAHAVRSALHGVARDQARVVPGLVMALAVLLLGAIPMFLLRLLLALGAPRARSTQ